MNFQSNMMPITKCNYHYDSGKQLLACSSNCMYSISQTIKNGFIVDNKSELFAFGMVRKVTRILYDDFFKEKEMFVLKIIPKDGYCEKNVMIPGKVYGKAGMIPELVKAGMVFCDKNSDATRASLLVNHISAMMNALEERKVFYHNGFFDGKFRFLTSEDAEEGVDAPYYQQKLFTGKIGIKKDLDWKEYLSKYSAAFGGENLVKLLTLMAASLLTSILSEKGLRFKRLVWLCGDNPETISRFLQIYSQDKDMSISLHNNVATLRRKMLDYRDSTIVFKGDGEKLNLLQQTFCYEHYPEVKVNNQAVILKPESICVIVSDYADDVLEQTGYCKLWVETGGVNIEPAIQGQIVISFMKKIEDYVGNKKIDEIIHKKYDLSRDYYENETERRNLTVLLCAYDVVAAVVSDSGLSLSQIHSGISSEELLADFIDNNVSDERPILIKMLALLGKFLASNAKCYRYDRGADIEVDAADDVVLYDDEFFYIYADTFDRKIIANLPEKIVKYKILCLGNKRGIIGKGSGRYTARLSVKIKGNRSDRSNWIAFKRKRVEFHDALPLVDKGSKFKEFIAPVMLGKDVFNQGAYLPIGARAVPNFHIGITGDSGEGKSYATLSIIRNLSKNGISSIIIDTEGSFSTSTLEKKFSEAMGEKLDYITLFDHKFPVNLFARQNICVNDKIFLEKDADVAIRCSNLFARSCNLSEKQKLAVNMALQKLLKDKNPEKLTLGDLCAKLENEEDECAKLARMRIMLLEQANVLREDGLSVKWEKFLHNGKCTIFSLSGFNDPMLKSMIAECILQEVWRHAKNSVCLEKPFAVVIDELVTMHPKSGSALSEILTIGRKFGVMCIWNSQFIKNKFEEEEIAVLNQSATQLYFNTSDLGEKHYIEKTLSKYHKSAELFTKLRKGTCLARGIFSSDLQENCGEKLLFLKIPQIE